MGVWLNFPEWAIDNLTKPGVLSHTDKPTWLAKPNNLFLHRNRPWAFRPNNNNRWRHFRDVSSKDNSRKLPREVENLASKNVWPGWRMFIRKSLDHKVEPDVAQLCKYPVSIVKAQWILKSSSNNWPKELQLRNVQWPNSKHTKKRWKHTKRLRK